MLTPEQLERRRHGIGSSDIAAIVGLSSWASPIDVWLEKTGRAVPSHNGDGLQLEIGNALEPLIAKLYTRDTGAQLRDPAQTVVSTPFEWKLATPDRIRVVDDVPVECKVAYTSDGWGEPGTDEIPQQYILQCQWQLDVLGADVAHVAAIIGRTFGIYVIRRDEALCEALTEAGERFWKDYVLPGMQPPVTAHERDKAYLQQAFANYQTKVVEATEHHECLAADLAVAREQQRLAEERVELFSNQLREQIGDAEGIQGAGWKCTWKAPKPTKKVDWEAVAQDLCVDEMTIARHTTEKQNSRRFLFTQKGSR